MGKRTPAELRTLDLVRQRLVVAVFSADVEDSALGVKPWYAISGGVLPTQLHTLWLAGLIRLDRDRMTYRVAGNAELVIGRVRLTPAGRRSLTSAQSPDSEGGAS